MERKPLSLIPTKMYKQESAPQFTKEDLDFFYDQIVKENKDINTLFLEYMLKSGRRFPFYAFYSAINNYLPERGAEIHRQQTKHPERISKEVVFSNFTHFRENLTIGDVAVKFGEMVHKKTGTPIVETQKGFIIAFSPAIN